MRLGGHIVQCFVAGTLGALSTARPVDSRSTSDSPQRDDVDHVGAQVHIQQFAALAALRGVALDTRSWQGPWQAGFRGVIVSHSAHQAQ